MNFGLFKLILLLCLYLNNTHSASSLSSDGVALLSLLRLWSSVPRPVISSWRSSDLTPCSWIGVECHDRTQKVVSLDLHGYGISGPLGHGIGKLASLEILDLSSNELSGPIPETLKNLQSLTVINLYNNSLSGEIPESLFRIRSLQELYLSVNNLNGSIPSNVGNLSNVAYMYLQSNSLSGSVPLSIGNCSELVELTLDLNQLSGFLPESLRSLEKLVHLNVAHNRFEGPIPSSLGDLKNLSFLDLSHNSFTGELTSSLGNCSSLTEFSAASNILVGSIPSSFGKLEKLEYLFLPENHFSGKIPPDLGKCRSLKELQLYTNELEGEIPSEMGLLSKLQSLELFNNRLSGKIPPSVWKILGLSQILVYNNSLSGTLPALITDLKQLRNISLFNNRFSGSLPQDFGMNSSLEQLDFTSNDFSGKIPPNLCFGKRLRILNLGFNRFEGSIPSQVGSCSSLKRLILKQNNLTGVFPDFVENPNLLFMDVSGNGISGPIPGSVGNCTSVSSIDLSGNKFTGPIPVELGRLVNLQSLMLSGNDLAGALPSELANCKKLAVLDVGFNSLNGSFPLSFRNLASLSMLVLSENRLTGGIPTFLSDLEKLSVLELGGNSLGGEIPPSIGAFRNPFYLLNLSNNGLRGKLPQEMSQLRLEQLDLSRNSLTGSLSALEDIPSLLKINISFNDFASAVPESLMRLLRLSPASFLGNPGLCARCLPSITLTCSTNNTLRPCRASSHRRNGLTGVEIAVIVVGSILLAIISGLCFFVFSRRPALKVRVPGVEGPSLLLRRVMEATENLNNRHIIGQGAHGTVYKALLGPNEAFAVKKLACIKHSNVHATMVREIVTLGKIRHRNLVKLVDFWVRKDYGLILYEYMENGSLHDVLHGNSRLMEINWSVRFNIALGTAHGLAYLHFDCDPHVVHRDIKPKNILLDSDMEPHIADFGIALLIDCSSPSTLSSSVIGTTGYIAPENAFLTKRSKESDVYSYGIVLLELITRKMAVDPAFAYETDIVGWVQSTLSDAGDVRKIIDPGLASELLDSSIMDQVVDVLEVALRCTEENPRSRPTMRDVVNQLVDACPHRTLSLKSL